MSMKTSPFDLATCARPNILKLQPYRCARDDYKDDGTNILLDANENAYGPSLAKDNHGFSAFGSLNRYPDPHQIPLKEQFCRLRNTHTHTSKDLKPENMFTGTGSDEAIDALFRCFCTPGKDKILTCPPTYGMYSVSADVNDISIVQVPLQPEDGFSLQPEAICDKLSSEPNIKMVYITSPGNPTAALIKKEDIRQILEHPTWNGVVIVDEAYIDFSPEGSSLAEWVLEWPNLVVLQTLSKAFGLAGIRLGVAFTSKEIAALLNNIKAPYNVSEPTSVIAIHALQGEGLKVMEEYKAKIVAQRDRMLKELPGIPGIGRIRGGTASNFLLVEILDKAAQDGGQPDNVTAVQLYEIMAEKRGVVMRFRGKELGCKGCVRITVGTEKEVDRFLVEIQSVLQQIFQGRGLEQNGTNGLASSGDSEEKREAQANAVIA
ncbi:hypothetical protein LTR84_000679 [Exophiala bonariae]|uniref:histidinol-phosphate transaminase n=1 Tax=Exophiala bonariae TaxID=1690606 RepID=A0AAV9NV96_9EURO|nr:hypothetical protein LTR84_000679 [Exophiala bonariae]